LDLVTHNLQQIRAKSVAAPLCRQRAPQQLHAQQRYFQFTARSEKGKSALFAM
jgi:hypothetical protein